MSADKSKCVDGSYGWIVVVFTMLVGFVPGSNMAKAISIAPIVCQNFMIDEATFGYVVAAFYIMGFIMAFPTTGFVNKMGMKVSVSLAVACGVIGSIIGAMAGTNTVVFIISRVRFGFLLKAYEPIDGALPTNSIFVRALQSEKA